MTSFIEERRMERAASLLRSTDMRVKEISFTLGFQHEASFDRAFSKKFQCTPTDYRKQRRLAVSIAEG